MPLIIDDNFSSYTTGATTYGSWYDANGGGTSGGTVVAGSGGIINNPAQPDNNFTPADGHIPPTTKAIFNYASDILTGPQSQGVICWSQLIIDGPPTTYLMHLDHQPPPTPGVALVLRLEADFSVTLVGTGGIWQNHSGGVSNSGIQYGIFVEVQIWHFFIVNYSATAIPHGGGTFTLGMGASVSMDGVALVDGTIDTGIVIASANNFTSVLGFRGGTNGLLTNVTFDPNPLATIPYPATPPLPLARFSQSMLEILKQAASPNARISEAMIEYLKRPVPNVRASQFMIEILKKINPVPPPGAIMAESGDEMLVTGSGAYMM
jgi:hypothetical protein